MRIRIKYLSELTREEAETATAKGETILLEWINGVAYKIEWL